ncbi:hypothetical protein [Sphingomonas psychrotolerans]|uniref:Serine protease n=1 Tax=Sphingomonas psychrotolerans TaxID=1327635 RepID=A0A2K8MF93_9SPHN|nr:hypothetical protein [Sphingomonas psychrotolerans]ATY32545.1 hypothetical protein CVN68_11640 [Sphingomonas psychrotolerans]
MSDREEKQFLTTGERLRSSAGEFKSVVGGLVSSAARGEIYAVSVAHTLESDDDDVATESGISLSGIFREIPRGGVGSYRSISNALSLSTVAADQLLEFDYNASWAGDAGVCAPQDAFQTQVTIGFRGGRQVFGLVTELGAVIMLKRGDIAPVGYHGALKITACEGTDFVTREEAGTPVFAEDGSLLGFLVIAVDDCAYVAPAQPLFDEVSIYPVDRAAIGRHNTVAEHQLELRGRRSASDQDYLQVARFSERLPAWRYRELRARVA